MKFGDCFEIIVKNFLRLTRQTASSGQTDIFHGKVKVYYDFKTGS